MSKRELEETLKRERIEHIEADKAWQAKVTELQDEIAKLKYTIEMLLADIANNENPNNEKVYKE